jgi:tetratricopeptide (TPR) repeat protein
MTMGNFRLRAISFGILLAFALTSAAFTQVSPESAEKYNAGMELFGKKRYQEAITAFDEAIELDSNNAQAFRAMGKTYQKLRDFDKAIGSFQMAVSVKPDYTAAFYEMGGLQLKLSKFKDAQASMKRVLSIDPQFEEGKAREVLKVAYLKQGTLYHRQKNYSKAAGEYENATQIDPTDASAFYNLGLAHKYARNFAPARTAFQTAVELDPKYAKAHRALGDLYRTTKRNSRAISSYQKAINSDPGCKDKGNINAYLNLAVIYSATKQHAKAAAIMQKAAPVAPTKKSKVKVYTTWGRSRALQKQYTRAVSSYKQALALDGKNAEAHYRLATAYFELKQYKSVIGSARRALGSRKYQVHANVIIGDAYEAQKGEGWKERAIEHYKKGLKDRRTQKYCEDKIDRILNPMGQEDEAEE